MQERDDFSTRRAHLAPLSDEELHTRFWDLANQIVTPLIKLAEANTSPSVERSVLLRLGFDSLDAKALVEMIADHGLLSKGAGHVVYVAAQAWESDALSAGRRLLAGEGWDLVEGYFAERRKSHGAQ